MYCMSDFILAFFTDRLIVTDMSIVGVSSREFSRIMSMAELLSGDP